MTDGSPTLIEGEKSFRLYKKNGEYICNITITVSIDDGTGDLFLQQDDD